MSKLVWDKVGEKKFELGVDHGVLYLDKLVGTTLTEYGNAYVWNGLISVSESADGGEIEKQYADNIVYAALQSTEDFSASVEAYTYPDEFAECDGSASLADGVLIGQQPRKRFGFSYRTKIGNDQDGQEAGYKLHLVYGCYAAPSDRDYETINDSPEAMTFSWDISTIPVPVTGYKPTAHIEIDSTKADPGKLAALEAILYGTDAEGTTPATSGYLPLPDAVAYLFSGT